jgi:hypothetical protein
LFKSWGCGSVVECLLSMCKTMSSISKTTQQNKTLSNSQLIFCMIFREAAWPTPVISACGRVRQKVMGSRISWTTWWVWGQPELQENTLSQKNHLPLGLHYDPLHPSTPQFCAKNKNINKNVWNCQKYR